MSWRTYCLMDNMADLCHRVNSGGWLQPWLLCHDNYGLYGFNDWRWDIIVLETYELLNVKSRTWGVLVKGIRTLIEELLLEHILKRWCLCFLHVIAIVNPIVYCSYLKVFTDHAWWYIASDFYYWCPVI